MADEVQITQVQDGIYLAERSLGEQGSEATGVRAALLLGERRAAVIDTLLCVEDMAPFLALIAAHGRPVVVVNTHADWDHCWGNAAFPGAPIVGHRLCRERILNPDTARMEEVRATQPARFVNAPLLAPDVTFETVLALDLGGLTLELHHLPGHTPDCLMSYVPERSFLYAGDCAEDPFPLLNSGPLDGWIAGLRGWAERDIATVVPAHGRISGVELLRANAEYLERLRGEAPLPAHTPASYVESHAENVQAARRLASS